MSLNGRRDGFSLADFEQCAEAVSMKRGRAVAIVEEVREAVAEWPVYAGAAGVNPADIARIGRAHRQSLPQRWAEPEDSIFGAPAQTRPSPDPVPAPIRVLLLIRLGWAVGFGLPRRGNFTNGRFSLSPSSLASPQGGRSGCRGSRSDIGRPRPDGLRRRPEPL